MTEYKDDDTVGGGGGADHSGAELEADDKYEDPG